MRKGSFIWISLSTCAAGHSAIFVEGKEDPYKVASVLWWLVELGHSKVVSQSRGEPAAEVVMNLVMSKGATATNATRRRANAPEHSKPD